MLLESGAFRVMVKVKILEFDALYSITCTMKVEILLLLQSGTFYITPTDFNKKKNANTSIGRFS
jgi:hypothetical protein